MANDGFIEFLSPNALSELKQAETLINSLASSIEKINKFKAPTSPSGADGAAKQMLADLKAQEQAIKNTTNALIQEEKVKQQVLATEIKQSNAIKANIAQREAERKATLAQQQAQEKAAKSAEREALANQRLNSAYNQLNASRTRAKNVLRDLIASETASNAEIRKAQKEFDILDKKVRKADVAVGDFSKRVGNYKTALSGVGNLMGAFGVATGLYLAADIAKNIYQTTKQLQSMDLALRMVSGSQSEFGNNQIFLTNLAEQYGIEIKGLTKNFTEFWVASKGKLEAEQIKAIFTSISKSVAIMGLSVEQQDSAFLALQQMMSKGTVQAEELKKQLGNALPGAVKAATMAYQALHPELKVTEEMFMKQMKAGKILSAELLPELAKAYEKLYGIENVKRAETLQAAQERLSNSWTQFVRNLNNSETGGLSRFFKYVLDNLSQLADFINYLNKDDRAISIMNENIVRGEADILRNLNQIKKDGIQTDKELIETAKLKQESAKKQVDAYGWENEALIRNAKEQAKIMADIRKNDPTFFANRTAYKDAKVELEETNKKIKENAVSFGYYQGIVKGTNTFIKEQNDLLSKKGVDGKSETDAERKARLKSEEDNLKRLEELRKYAYERRISDLEREKEQIKDLRDLETTSLEDKLFLENAFAAKQIQLNQTIYDEKIRLAEKNADLEKIALNELLTANENALSDSLDRQQKLKEDALKEDAEKTKEWYKKNPPMFFMTDEMRKQYEEAQKKIQDLKNEFRDYIQSFGQEFFSNAGFADTFDFFLRMDQDGKTMFDKLNENALDSKEKFAATFQAITQTAQEAFNFISDASQRNFEAEYKRLEQQKDVALLFAGESAEARDEIERQYEQRRKEIARREAKAKKQQAIFNIAIDTAQGIMAAVMKSPLTGGLPWSAIVAAIGAAQIAMVSSQEIPQYWKGTDNAEGGLAWTQERGREIITDSQGRVKSLGSDKGAELTMLSKGDKVFTAEKSAMMFDDSLNSMLLNNGIVMPKIEVSMDTQILGSKLDKLSDTIASKESFSIVRDAKGERVYQRKQNERKELLNNILNVKTYGV
jgi:tape measure domain-containing protein